VSGASLADKLRLQWRKLGWARARRRARRGPGHVELGAQVRIDPSAAIVAGRGERVVVGDGCKIGRGALLATQGGWIEVGAETTVQPYCVLYGHGGLRIGSYVRIATHVVVIPANHLFDDPTRPIASQGETREGVVIEDDVWIGAHATILDGCRIGRGAVVAAGAVVTRDVPEFAVVAGVPARVVKTRGEAAAETAAG
jgi:acetyltransferase-like isoleucine patch superfamily enzyme